MTSRWEKSFLYQLERFRDVLLIWRCQNWNYSCGYNNHCIITAQFQFNFHNCKCSEIFLSNCLLGLIMSDTRLELRRQRNVKIIISVTLVLLVLVLGVCVSWLLYCLLTRSHSDTRVQGFREFSCQHQDKDCIKMLCPQGESFVTCLQSKSLLCFEGKCLKKFPVHR